MIEQNAPTTTRANSIELQFSYDIHSRGYIVTDRSLRPHQVSNVGLYYATLLPVQTVSKGGHSFEVAAIRIILPLWGEEERLRERYRKFDVEELKRIAAESIGAKTCVPMIKLAEGGYNKVFRLVMDNGSVAVADNPV